MAKQIEIRVAHSVGADEALERVRALGDYYQNKHNAKVSWDGATGRIAGRALAVSFDVNVTVGDQAVVALGKDPGMLLRGKVTKYLTGKIETYLDPKTPVDKLPRG